MDGAHPPLTENLEPISHFLSRPDSLLARLHSFLNSLDFSNPHYSIKPQRSASSAA